MTGTPLPLPKPVEKRFERLVVTMPDSDLALMQSFVGTPYTWDGVLNEEGRFATFHDPVKPAHPAGLVCAGFVVSAVRHLLKLNLPLDSLFCDFFRKGATQRCDDDNPLLGLNIACNLWMRSGRTPVLMDGGNLFALDPTVPLPDSFGAPAGDPASWLRLADSLPKQCFALGVVLGYPRPSNPYGFDPSVEYAHHLFILYRDGKDQVHLFESVRPSGVKHLTGIKAISHKAMVKSRYYNQRVILIGGANRKAFSLELVR